MSALDGKCVLCDGDGVVFENPRRRVTKCLACDGTGRVLMADDPSAGVRSIPPSGIDVPMPTEGDYPSDADILRRVARWLGFEGEVDLARVLAEIDRLRDCERQLLEFKRKQTSAPTGRGPMR